MAHLMTARIERIDWKDIKDRVDMVAIATALFGPALKRSGRRLNWCCPFHTDHDPSLQVDPAEGRWKCWPCNLAGDAPALVMRLNGVGFPEAVRVVAELAGIVAPSRNPTRPRPPARADPAPPSMPTGGPPGKAAARPSDGPTGLPEAAALALVYEAAARLWTPEGRAALAYLRGRGLTEATIRAARLGWTPGVMLPTSDGSRTWPASGIVIPWFDAGRLAMVKIRQPEGSKPKYAETFRDRPALFPGPEAIRPGAPLVITEGEFDALLLGQELAELASVLTLGSASIRPEGSTYLALLRCPAWYAGHDADEAGDRAAAEWPARAVRVRPPAKDWTDAHRAGVDLRRFWADALERGPFLARLQARGIRLDGEPVHPRIGVGTCTGRITYTDPPLQGMSKSDRPARLAPATLGRRFVRADYGQIEPRILLAILRGRGLIAWDAGGTCTAPSAGTRSTANPPRSPSTRSSTADARPRA